jgi:SEC-C motif domain protein
MPESPDKFCVCGSGRSPADCCGVFLNGASLPATAEQLMRSRYAAYVAERIDYLMATWHPETRPATLSFESEQRPRWLGLKVRRCVAVDADHALVEFVARYRINGRAFRLHETSRFERIEGRWYYRDGDVA